MLARADSPTIPPGGRGDMPSLGALRLVDAACRHGNYRAAGRELNVSHSAISQQVARLEQQLNVKLFKREGSVMRATPAGQELAEGYRRALQTLERSLERATTQAEAAELVASLPASLANPWLHHRLHIFSTGLSGTRIEARGDDIEPDFRQVDIAVITDAAPRKGLWTEHLFDRSVTPVCSPTFLKAHPMKDPRQLLDMPLLVHDRALWATWFAAAGVKAQKLASGPLLDPTMAIGAAINGYGVAMACRLSASTDLERGRLVQPFDLWAEAGTSFHLAWPEDHPRPERIDAFASWMRGEIARSLSGPARIAPAA